MTRRSHVIYIGLMSVIVFVTLLYLSYTGFSYYSTKLEERVFHVDHTILKPSGSIGHGAGIIGSLCMITGIASYMARKRFRVLSRLGLLKHWLEFHIFLCTLGPLLVLFHTSFKFGGIVAISFWSMVAVFISGIIGRFIYLQIPHSIEGRALDLNEVRAMQGDISEAIRNSYQINEESYNIIVDSVKRKVGLYYRNPVIRYIRRIGEARNSLSSVRKALKISNMPSAESRKIISLVREDIRLSRRIEQLDTMQNLFKYWHVIHLPFAMVMIIIMLIHIAVTLLFGYRWIF